MFWYVGLIPDLATLRDRATAALGKRRLRHARAGLARLGAALERYETAYLLLAGLATPLVVSVHSVVELRFRRRHRARLALARSSRPTSSPGAIFSGFAMVLTLAIPLRAIYGLQDFITDRHLDNMAKVMLATGLIVAYGYLMEAFMAWYSGNAYETYVADQPRCSAPTPRLLGADRLQRAAIPQSSGSARAPQHRCCCS